ncbi:MAG: GNAT family N-acetyltransferase [bacterium]
MEIRILQPSDDRSAFRSGDVDLDRFLQRYAGQNQFRHHLGSTYVAVDQGRILGYATVAPGQLEIDDLPGSLRKKLPAYPLPILRLARLAVDEAARGQGLGKELLRFVLQLAIRLARDYGCTGVLVDAKAEAEAFYEKLGFVPLEVIEGQSDARPAPTPMFLSVWEIQAAARRPL